ncbi:MAG: acyltransferase [Lachnospiraceae bacterium]|nr:acyltransferase [Lachnospiraceae bacterium]
MNDSFIGKTSSKMLKGIAILMMVSMHLLKTSWIDNPSLLIDLKICGEFVSHVLAESLHASTSIFAFCTGYIWGGVYRDKKPLSRILSLYVSFWIITLTINFPLQSINQYIISGNVAVSPVIVIKSLLAITSEISKFCWYISFYALAVITFPLLKYLLSKFFKRAVMEVVGIIAIFLAIRVMCLLLNRMEVFDSDIYSLLSRYNQTMPRLLIGTAVYKYGVYDKWNEKGNANRQLLYSVLFMIILTIGKMGLRLGLGIDSEIDMFWIIYEMYALTVIVKRLKELDIAKKVLVVLGDYSMYIWLIHAVFLLDFIQPYLYGLRLPIVIVAVAVLTSLVISVPIKMLDVKVKKLVKLI